MPPVLLSLSDLFVLVRALAFDAIKALKRTSDVFGEELNLTPGSAVDQPPLAATPEQREAMAKNVLDFFCLPAWKTASLLPLPTLGAWARFIFDRVGARPCRVGFLTSGSTGLPSLVVKPYFHLEQDCRLLAEPLKKGKRFLTLVPPHHIYGFLFNIMIPKVLGTPVLNMRFSKPRTLIAEISAGDVLIGFPHYWKMLAANVERFPEDVIGTTSTGPCPAEVIRALKAKGLSSMLEIYGSSESGAMGTRTDPGGPLTLFPAWKRVGDNTFARQNEDGSLGEPVAFQDELDWVTDTTFVVKGRLDKAVQVAGVNVYPGRTAEVLRACPLVADCAVRLMRPDEGDRLKAFIVPRPGVELTEEVKAELRRYILDHLAPLEQPKSLTFGDALPRNVMGKLADWTVAKGRLGLTKEEAIAELRLKLRPVPAGQSFTVDALAPEDAFGVSCLFYTVYGEEYPFDLYYIPERLNEEHRRGNVSGVVARTDTGDIVAYGALFTSSSANPAVRELGQYMVLPAYGATQATLRIQEHLLGRVVPKAPVEALFDEAVCHHVAAQKFAAVGGLKESGLEIGLLPAKVYERMEYVGDRVSTLLMFRLYKDAAAVIHVPPVYLEAVRTLAEGLGLAREIGPSEDAVPEGQATSCVSQIFEPAQVARANILTMGKDFPEVIEAFERQAAGRGVKVFQVFVNLGERWCAEGVTFLRARGYFLGGLLPLWFGGDGLLLQKVLDMPERDSIKLYSDRAHRILDLIAADIAANPACQGFKTKAEEEARIAVAATPAMALAEVVIRGQGLTVDEVVAVARHGAKAALTDDAAILAGVHASAAFIEWATATGEPIYGVNTGFGGMANVPIGRDDMCALQQNLIHFLHAGSGGYLPREDVRAAMLLRANSHLRGASGIRQELIERMLTFINRGVTPMVRDMGSIGASGDLVPLASITGALIGAAPSFTVDWDGRRLDALTALSELGLSPIALGPKEGLSMVNGTSVMTGIAANCCYEARQLTTLALAFHALAVQALGGSNQSFHPFIQRVKPHRGQILAAERMLTLLAGSKLCRDELDGHHDLQGDQPAQDRYSLRCLPQFVGPLLDTVTDATAAIEVEMNSASDNPLIDAAACVSFHSGNFLGQYVAVWMDRLRHAVGLLAKHMDAQIALMVSPEFSGGLPASLVGNPGRMVNMGLKGLQIAANAVMPLLSFYGAPIADRFPTHAEQFNQNINSQGFNAAVLARKTMETFRTYTAMALLFGVQAVSLRSKAKGAGFDASPLLSPPTAALYEAVLAAVGKEPSNDRPLIWNDDEQSLEALVEKLTADIAAEGGVVKAVGRLANV